MTVGCCDSQSSLASSCNLQTLSCMNADILRGEMAAQMRKILLTRPFTARQLGMHKQEFLSQMTNVLKNIPTAARTVYLTVLAGPVVVGCNAHTSKTSNLVQLHCQAWHPHLSVPLPRMSKSLWTGIQVRGGGKEHCNLGKRPTGL